jgi:hypothetical protein
MPDVMCSSTGNESDFAFTSNAISVATVVTIKVQSSSLSSSARSPLRARWICGKSRANREDGSRRCGSLNGRISLSAVTYFASFFQNTPLASTPSRPLALRCLDFRSTIARRHDDDGGNYRPYLRHARSDSCHLLQSFRAPARKDRRQRPRNLDGKCYCAPQGIQRMLPRRSGGKLT